MKVMMVMINEEQGREGDSLGKDEIEGVDADAPSLSRKEQWRGPDGAWQEAGMMMIEIVVEESPLTEEEKKWMWGGQPWQWG